jgi:hypothetical protein
LFENVSVTDLDETLDLYSEMRNGSVSCQNGEMDNWRLEGCEDWKNKDRNVEFSENLKGSVHLWELFNKNTKSQGSIFSDTFLVSRAPKVQPKSQPQDWTKITKTLSPCDIKISG